MDLEKYGPFANVVIIASALITTFSILLLKMVGKINNWTWMTDNPPSRIVTVGARIVTISLMAFTYISINKSNVNLFGVVAILCGLIGLFYINRFNHMRKLHIISVPVVGPTGQQLIDAKGQPVVKNLVIGLESNMTKIAKSDFNIARKEHGAVSMEKFMSGYGPNDPGAIWDKSILSSISNKLTMSLVNIALFGVMTLFLAAFVIEVFMAQNIPVKKVLLMS